MRFKRIIALLCAAIYITISGAAAAELPQTALSGESESLISLEVEMAEQASTQTDLPVAQVAASVGYIDLSRFSRLFKAEIGLTPAQYRIKGREGPL